MRKLKLAVIFFIMCFCSISVFADSGVLIKTAKVNDLPIKKGTQVIILSESETAYKLKYNQFVFLTTKDCVMKTSTQVKTESGQYITKEVATQAYLKDDLTVKVDGKPVSLNKGSKIALYNYDGEAYTLKDSNGITFKLPESVISFEPIVINKDYSMNTKMQEYQKKIIKNAVSKLGITYVWGGTSRRGYDCSGFTQSVYSSVGISIPKYSQTQAKTGIVVKNFNDLKIGDLIFFDSDGGSNINHVAMYIGNKKMVHASASAGKVVIEDMSTSKLVKNYTVVMKRILDENYLSS